MRSFSAVYFPLFICFVTAEASTKIETGGPASRGDPVSVQLFYHERLYFVDNFVIGTPGQYLRTGIITNFSYTLVYPSGCSGCPIGNLMGYNHDLSSLFEPVGNETQVAIPNGPNHTTTGTFSGDTVNLNGLILQNQWILERDDYVTVDPEAPSVLLGMGYDDGFNFGATPVLANLAQAGLNSSFSLSLNGKKAPSWLDVGAPNSSHYKGSFTYIPVTNPSNWEFKINSVLASEHPSEPISTNVDAWVDITTEYMYGPMEEISHVYQWIGATQGPDGQPEVPCSKVANLPNLYFILGEHAKVFTPAEYIKQETNVEVGPGGEGLQYGERCTSKFMGMEGSGWRLGTSFIKDNYVYFDAQNNRIGYAVSYF